jgi:pimeloyl-ACP methyl ester carboxylesterase
LLRKVLAIAATAILAIYLGICGLLYKSQRAYLYVPVPRRVELPSFVMTSGDADVVVSTNGVDSPQAVLYFGGNAEDVSQAVALLAKAFPGRAVYAMHYRGYGGSTGSPSEQGLVEDAGRLFDQVATNHQGIVVVGRSLGSGIALQVAAGRRAERLVLVTPYDSITELAAAQYPLLPVGLLLQDMYESWRYAPRIKVPTTVIVAERDEVIPKASSRRLAERFAPGIATVVNFPGAGHNDVSDAPGYLAALAGTGAFKVEQAPSVPASPAPDAPSPNRSSAAASSAATAP